MRKKIVFLLLGLSMLFVACQGKNLENADSTTEQARAEAKEVKKVTLSNMIDQDSIDEVQTELKVSLNAQNVDTFIKTVVDYNETVENVSLNKGFEEQEQPIYDMDKISSLWSLKKGSFIGTNCRINTFMLLKDNIKVQPNETDDSNLFMDNDAIEVGKIFDEEDTRKFRQLFSKVKTQASDDVAVHAAKMEEYFSNIEFCDGAKMVSVVLHDNLDGDYLFIGHVGVLVESKGGYLFVEKVSFEEPYQAIKFENKEDCYSYLMDKYRNYKSENTAGPFIMENGKVVKM